MLSAVTQLEPSSRIGADSPLSLLAETKLVGAVGIEPTSEDWEVFEDLHSLLFPPHAASSMRKLIVAL